MLFKNQNFVHFVFTQSLFSLSYNENQLKVIVMQHLNLFVSFSVEKIGKLLKRQENPYLLFNFVCCYSFPRQKCQYHGIFVHLSRGMRSICLCHFVITIDISSKENNKF